ncbi:MAG: methyltransferase [Pseudomonadota bacterium]
MSATRLSIALNQGLVNFDGAKVAVWGARAGQDLAGVPTEALFVSAFRPDYDALAAAGRRVKTTVSETLDAAIVFVPREKALARAMVAEAARLSRGPVVVDGAKTHGIEAILRKLRSCHDVSQVISKAHGKLGVVAPGADLAAWADPGPRQVAEGFLTRLGVFSADGADPGSRLLVDHLPQLLGARVADLGAGWGYLSRAVLTRRGVAALDLVEADLVALDCAKLNVEDARAQFHWADATRFGAPNSYDTIVTNPPFHTARAANPSLGQSFLDAAARLLRPKGQLWLVANRQLPYERTLAGAFKDVAEMGGDRTYKIVRAARLRT